MILVGVDHSMNSYSALRWAVTDGESTGDEVHAVHAVADFPDDGIGVTGLHEAPAAEYDELVGFIEHALHGTGQLTRVVPHVVAGDPADEVIGAARDLDAELVVIGRRGHGLLASALPGSVANALAHRAPLPLVVVPGSDLAWPSPKRVVVGVDGSEHGIAALRWAAREARRHAASLLVVHVTHAFDPAPIIPFPMAPPPANTDVVDRALARLQNSHQGPYAIVERLTVAGTAARTLCDIALPSDVLVVGRRGLGTLGRLLLGSTSSYAVTHAECPVIVVP